MGMMVLTGLNDHQSTDALPSSLIAHLYITLTTAHCLHLVMVKLLCPHMMRSGLQILQNRGCGCLISLKVFFYTVYPDIMPVLTPGKRIQISPFMTLCR